ncbi:MAG: cadherin repeat domain-containing protein, partial [Deltaproteobacteria bacterium]|nr:cadherin repeat domain-containing protein [Deltaproteobacteria bacterium]
MDSHAQKSRPYLIVGVTVLAASLAACGGGSSGGGGSPNPPPPPPPPPSNNAPQLSGPSDFTFDENQTVAFDIQASDADGQTVTFTLESTGDGALFSIDSSSGQVTDITPAGYFDFENPQDLDGDNNYELNVVLSDGVATTDVLINVNINDVEGPLTCSSGDTVSVDENFTGRVYEFAARKPDTEPGQIMFEGMLSVTRQGAGVVSDDMLFSLSLNPVSRVLSLFHILNAESEGDLANAYTISTTVRIDQETANCSVNLQIEDAVNEVTSGIKFSGSYPNAIVIRSGSIGDLDGDGLNELWLGSRKEISESPWEHQGHVVFGQAISD